MQAADDTHDHPIRRLISYVIDTGPVNDGQWRWKFTRILALFGPGSVPFAVILASTQNQILRDDYGMGLETLIIGAATGTAVILARFRPIWAWALVLGSLIATALFSVVDQWQPWPATAPTVFALLVMQFALARDCRVWIAIGGWLSYTAVGVWAIWAFNTGAVSLNPLNAVGGPNPATDNLPLTALLGAVAFLIGLSVRIWRQGRVRIAEEERVSEEERTRRRVLEERTRLARELHDIVAHHMSVIAVQASTAEYRISDLSEEAKDEFRSIGGQARGSLAEMRRLLTVLRSEDQTQLREPQPGPEALASLVEAVDRSGTPTTLAMQGMPDDLPETIALTVFRVVQEALSNVVRHAAGAETDVEVQGVDGQVVITVVNAAPPPGAGSPETQGTGLGLAGMRERVALEGGTLETGTTAEGGFAVRAVLPTTATAPAGSATEEGTA
ncbi:sensor histidine kinase [Glycomyces buryatensis]|uniref:histidine kinase n=1 Tax=Glycomyces buryatensis TaxID=2570927 RepID=A0A4S8QL90_9ACTN|nr:sensor histidine kinase [Glycomyces buryatensis]THV42189.1 sensor histidine kinase [Glycomyces buryatensis]